MLNYNIKGTGLDINDELRSYVEKKLAHVEKFLQRDPSTLISVELEHQAMRNGDNDRAEFTVHASGAVYRASVWGETMRAAIDLSLAELQNELSRNKKKKVDLVRRGAARAKAFLQGWRAKL